MQIVVIIVVNKLKNQFNVNYVQNCSVKIVVGEKE
jgi:hypothetical protein